MSTGGGAQPGGGGGDAEPGPSGLLVIDKPIGRTSMDVCRVVKRALIAGGAPRRIKVGHGGTLDPLATGVLIVLVGNATKLCERVMAGTKRYEAIVDLSAVSSTDDAEGELEIVAVSTPPTLSQIQRACEAMTGDIQQRPPAYSAIKVAGRRAYALARRGQKVQLSARTVRVESIRVTEYRWPRADLEVVCGKGTYIRSLARDLGGLLGTGGMLAALRRTAVGEFTVSMSKGLDHLSERLTQPDLLVAGP